MITIAAFHYKYERTSQTETTNDSPSLKTKHRIKFSENVGDSK